MKSRVVFRSDNDEWSTPQNVFDKLNDEFGFDLDPCASEENHKCDEYYTKEDDGLTKSWEGRRVFCNPPYSQMTKWVEKCYREGCKDNTLVVLLIPSRTDTRYFHDFIYQRSEIRFIRGRLRFGGHTEPAPFPSMAVIFRGAYVKEYVMRQQCRYCTQAVAQTEDTAYCDHLHQMVGKRATSTNCEGYEFCKIDAFYVFRGLEPEDPRAWYKPREKTQTDERQITWKDVIDE